MATAATNSALSHQKTVGQQVLQYIRRKKANIRTPSIQVFHLKGVLDETLVSGLIPSDNFVLVFAGPVAFPETDIFVRTWSVPDTISIFSSL